MKTPPATLAPGHPAVLRFEIPAAGSPICAALAVVRMGDEPGELAVAAGSWLVGSELERCERFLVEPARADFLAGRIAGKAALQALDSRLLPTDCEIVSGIWQQPCLRPGARGLAVTLAHAGGAGIALAFDDRWLAGIDIELLDRANREVIATVVCGREQNWADAAPDAVTRQARWGVLWTARESLGKMLRTGIARPGLLAPLTAMDETSVGWTAHVAGAEDIGVHATRAGSHVVSIVAPSTEGSAAAIQNALGWLRETLS